MDDKGEGDYFRLQEGQQADGGGGRDQALPAGAPGPIGPPVNGAPVARGVVVPALETGAPVDDREWEGSWWECCGRCDGEGWGVCLLTSWCFPCTFGFLNYRALGNYHRALGWGILFFCLIGAPFLIDAIFWEAEPEEHDSDDDDAQQSVRTKFREHETLLVAVWYITVALAFVIIVGVGYWNRTQMRRRFRIKGQGGRTCECCEASPENADPFLWTFCGCCVTCQEVRTVLANRVERGEWQGPITTAVGGQYIVAQPPPPQRF